MFDRRLIQHFDWVLLLLAVIVTAIGIVNLYSATHAIREMGGAAVFYRQIYWFLIGLLACLFMTTFNYHLLERLAYPTYFLAVFLLVLVLLVGRVTSGSQRWLSLGFISFQPSELAKLALIMVLARFLSQGAGSRVHRLRDLWQPLLLIAVPCGLILKEPDLGTAILIAAVSLSMILFVRVNGKSLAIAGIAVLSLTPLIWSRLKEYQRLRILTFLKPELDPLGAGYHVTQSKITIGSGQFWGKGFLKGTQTRLHFLPEQHTDFAFSVLAEEWGFVGAVVLLLLYLFLIVWAINVARNSKDKFGSILATGVAAMIFWQVVINVGMVTGLVPVVGIPLVLFSYGGTSLVMTMASIGLLMNVSMRRFMFQ